MYTERLSNTAMKNHGNCIPVRNVKTSSFVIFLAHDSVKSTSVIVCEHVSIIQCAKTEPKDSLLLHEQKASVVPQLLQSDSRFPSGTFHDGDVSMEATCFSVTIGEARVCQSVVGHCDPVFYEFVEEVFYPMIPYFLAITITRLRLSPHHRIVEELVETAKSCKAHQGTAPCKWGMHGGQDLVMG
eukprot:scaffold10022_cov170-Amphora_coffeaeformis.AAC.4